MRKQCHSWLEGKGREVVVEDDAEFWIDFGEAHGFS
jgi:hypothetical protein